MYELALLPLPCISDTSHLSDLLECLRELTDWQTLGVHLKISYETLESIEIEHHRVVNRKTAMLVHWLRTGTADKQTLLLALRKMD